MSTFFNIPAAVMSFNLLDSFSIINPAKSWWTYKKRCFIQPFK